MEMKKVAFPKEKVEVFCSRHHILRLSVFGSALREDFDPAASDVDILVEFEPGQKIGFLGLARLEMELSEMLGFKVDLRTPAELSRYFRKAVIDSAETQYAAG
jgi:uncharacterized protein